MLLLGGAVTAAQPLRAQQKAVPVIGYLDTGSFGPSARYVAAFLDGLGETGWVAGQSVAIEYRWAEGRLDQLPALAAELVGRNVDVIVASGGFVCVLAAKGATDCLHRRQRSGRERARSRSRPSGRQHHRLQPFCA